MPDLLTVSDVLTRCGAEAIEPAEIAELASALSDSISAGDPDLLWRSDVPTEVLELLLDPNTNMWRDLTRRSLRTAENYLARVDELTFGPEQSRRLTELARSDPASYENEVARLAPRELRASDQREVDKFDSHWQDLLDLHDHARTIGELLMPKSPNPILSHAGDPSEDSARTEFRAYLRTGDEVELRAAGTATGAAGGYTVPEGFRNTVTESMVAFGGIRRLAEVITTDTGATLPWPTNDDTANAGAILTENTADTEQDVTFGQKSLGSYMYTSKMVRASMQLLQDGGFDIEGWLARQLGQRIARAQAAHWVTGTGTAQPQGLLTGSTTGKTAAATTAIIYDELVDLVHSIDLAYREGGEISDGNAADPSVAWVMADSTFAYLRKIRDDSGGAGIGRPLIDPDVRGGLPTTLLGYRIVVDNSMPAIAAAASPILFGNIRAGYVIRDVGTTEVLRLTERYGEYLQVGFLGYQRSDGLVQDASAVKKLTMAAA